MADSEIIGALIGAIGIVLTIIGMAVKSTRAISKAETEIRSDMDAQIDNLQRDIVRLDRSALERSDTVTREFGETCAAIRQKLHEVEVFSRDHFVSKDSFEAVVGRFERTVEKMTDRLENKFDKAVDRFHQRPD